jgi:hypothetical protein
LERLPHDRCAVQWDVAVEFGLLEGIEHAERWEAQVNDLGIRQ